MPSVTPSADQTTALLQSGLSAFFSSAKMGYVGYILFGLFSLGLFFFGAWLKKQEIIAAKKASDAQAVKDQAKNKTDNQTISANLDNARGTIDQVRNANPDAGKQKRNVDGASQ